MLESVSIPLVGIATKDIKARLPSLVRVRLGRLRQGRLSRAIPTVAVETVAASCVRHFDAAVAMPRVLQAPMARPRLRPMRRMVVARSVRLTRRSLI